MFKHDSNTAVKKTNINVLQCYEDAKLYVSPSYTVQRSISPASPNSDISDQLSASVTSETAQKVTEICNSVKLRRKVNVTLINETPSKNATDTGEIGAKDLITQITDKLAGMNVSQWFNFGVTPDSETNLFEPIYQALNHIDFNLKRNSDFINELTKLLDTSRSIKQESNLKKIAKAMEGEKQSLTVPPSPVPPKKEEVTRKKSFSLLSIGSKSPRVSTSGMKWFED